jgi:hypothetical protein
MDHQLEGRQSLKTFYATTFGAIAFVSVVGLPASIHKDEPVQGSPPGFATSIVAVAPADQTPADKPLIDVQGSQEERPAKLAVAPPGEVPSSLPPEIVAKPIASALAPSIRNDEVNRYLWSVYQRSSLKIDSHGDFTWKDAAAAARVGLPIEEYVIGGMDRDFRQLLFAAGRALDAAGVDWTFLSAFRDDYRQTLAAGLKARSDNSFHGGSVATGGYGHGCAVDVASTDRLSDNAVWNWLDQHGEQYGLRRPFRAIDPAHVQPRPGWRELASMLRGRTIATRSDVAPADSAGADPLEPTSPASTDDPSFDGLTEEQFSCVRPPVVSEPNPKPVAVHRLSSLAARRPTSTAESNSSKAKWKTGRGTPIHGIAATHALPIHPHVKTGPTHHLAELESPATRLKHAPSPHVQPQRAKTHG